MDQGGDLAAELSESDSADWRLPGTGLPVSVAAARRTLLAWLLWAPVIRSLSQSSLAPHDAKAERAERCL